jgi:hypothetical protein
VQIHKPLEDPLYRNYPAIDAHTEMAQKHHNLHEDKSFVVLSQKQQRPQWQSARIINLITEYVKWLQYKTNEYIYGTRPKHRKFSAQREAGGCFYRYL